MESQNKNSQIRNSESQEQTHSPQSNKNYNYSDKNENSDSTPAKNISSRFSTDSNIKADNSQEINELKNHHSTKNKINDSIKYYINQNPINESDNNLSINNSTSTNISDINIISDVSGEIIPKNKLLKMFREEHNNKIKKTKKILRDADYRHAQYNSQKKSRSSSRSKSGSNPNLDSNKAILNSIPESIKQSPGNNMVNSNVDNLNVKERSPSIGSLVDKNNSKNIKTDSQKNTDNNSETKESPYSNRIFSSHASPEQIQANNSLEEIASYNSSSHHEEMHSHHKHRSSKRKRKRPQLVLSPVQCNNFFSNSSNRINNPIQACSVNANHSNLSPSDGQNFQFTPPSKANLSNSKANDDIKTKTKPETHFSSNLIYNSSIDFETVNAAPSELQSSSSFVTESAINGAPSALSRNRGIEFPINSTLSDISMNFCTEPLNFSQIDDDNSEYNASFTKKKTNNSNLSNLKYKNSYIFNKSNSIIERNAPQISDIENKGLSSANESNLYTYETVDVSDTKSWTYMSIYDYEYEEDEVGNALSNEAIRKREAKIDSKEPMSDKNSKNSARKESGSEKERRSQSHSGKSGSERGSRHQSQASKKESDYDRMSNKQNQSGAKESEHQSQLSQKESERSSKNQSQLSYKETGGERSRKSENSGSKIDNDKSFDSKGSSPKKRNHSNDNLNSSKSNQSKSGNSQEEINSIKVRGLDLPPSPRIEEIKQGIEHELQLLHSPHKDALISRKVESPRTTNKNSRLNNANSGSNSCQLGSEKKESDFHFENESENRSSNESAHKRDTSNAYNAHSSVSHNKDTSNGSNAHSSVSHNKDTSNGSNAHLSVSHNKDTSNVSNAHSSVSHKRDTSNGSNVRLNLSAHKVSVSQESFTEIFDKCTSGDHSYSAINSSKKARRSRTSSKSNSCIDRRSDSSDKLSSLSHISKGSNEELALIRNISQIPNDTKKNLLGNPSKEQIMSLLNNVPERQENNPITAYKSEQSLSLASSESESNLSSSSPPSPLNNNWKPKLTQNEISRDVRSFSIQDIDRIIEEDKEKEKDQNHNSSNSSIKPRKIDFSSNSSSSRKRNRKEKEKQNKDQSNTEKASSNQEEKEDERNQKSKSIFPAFNLPSSSFSSSASSSVRSPHSFDSKRFKVFDGSDTGLSSSSSSILSSSSTATFNTLRVTIVEVETSTEMNNVNVSMFVASDPRNIAETEKTREKSTRHVFKETFNVSLEGIKENEEKDGDNEYYKFEEEEEDDEEKKEKEKRIREIMNEGIISDLCIVVRQNKKFVGMTKIPISTKTFKIGHKVDRWYDLVPTNRIRLVGLAVNQENRYSPKSRSNSGINNSNSNLSIDSSDSNKFLSKKETKINHSNDTIVDQKSPMKSKDDDENEDLEIDIDFDVDIKAKNRNDERSKEQENDSYNTNSFSEEIGRHENDKGIVRVNNFKPFEQKEENSEYDDEYKDKDENSQSLFDTLASVLD